MQLYAAAGGGYNSTAGREIFPPAVIGPAQNTDWTTVLTSRAIFHALVADAYGDKLEQGGTNWIRP